eukprot:988916-Prorocentrum_minimum.AAC.2
MATSRPIYDEPGERCAWGDPGGEKEGRWTCSAGPANVNKAIGSLDHVLGITSSGKIAIEDVARKRLYCDRLGRYGRGRGGQGVGSAIDRGVLRSPSLLYVPCSLALILPAYRLYTATEGPLTSPTPHAGRDFRAVLRLPKFTVEELGALRLRTPRNLCQYLRADDSSHPAADVFTTRCLLPSWTTYVLWRGLSQVRLLGTRGQESKSLSHPWNASHVRLPCVSVVLRAFFHVGCAELAFVLPTTAPFLLEPRARTHRDSNECINSLSFAPLICSDATQGLQNNIRLGEDNSQSPQQGGNH